MMPGQLWMAIGVTGDKIAGSSPGLKKWASYRIL